MTHPRDTAVFLARVWWENEQFRARITYTGDVRAEPSAETRILTADPAEVRERLALWLEEFTATGSA